MEALLKKPVGFPGPLSTPENVGKKNPVHIGEKKKGGNSSKTFTFWRFPKEHLVFKRAVSLGDSLGS